MPVSLILLIAGVSLVVAVFAVRDLLGGAAFNRSLGRADAVDAVEASASRLSSRLDRRLRRTRLGAAVDRSIVRSGVRTTVVAIVSLNLGGFLVGWALFSVFLPGPLALVLAVASGYGPFIYLRRRQNQRSEEFIAQLPELARVLSNAASAGLSLRSAISLVAEELSDPAADELRRTADALAIGRSLPDALKDLERRVPSRELAVLVSTLVISSRSGGSVVTALRNIATTLDGRKELRREVRTQLAQAVASSYLVFALGVGIILGIALLSPDTFDSIVSAGPGRIALLAAAAFFTVGFLLVKRITRIQT